MSRFPRGAVLIVICTWALAVTTPRAQEAQDNPGVPRFPGMEIEYGRATDFDGHDFQITAAGETQRVEGKSWEFTYALRPGARSPSPLEIVRNYGNQFVKHGGKVVFQTADATMATMKMPLGGGERWLSLVVNNGGEQILMRIIETAPMTQKLEVSAAEMVQQIADTGKVILRGILFDTAKSDIKPESAAILDEVAVMMKQSAAVKFRIDGHTDNVGAKPANLALSRARAAAVRAALISRGIDATRLTSEGFADAQPVADNATAEGRAQNRRVELVKQ